MTDLATRAPFGVLLRDWRRRRHLSQLDLALEAGVSARHVSFVETGRSKPSPEMVLQLADRLEVPLRERNRLLLAAGYAPLYGQRPLDDPELAAVREAVQVVLDGHEPYPALVVDRGWNIVAANAGLGLLTQSIAPELLEPPANALRATLHPDGLAPQILNLGQWRAHVTGRLEREAALTGDPHLAALLDELAGYPGGRDDPDAGDAGDAGSIAAEIAVPLRLRTPGGELAFLSTVTTFGTAVDVTVAELSIESFFPADERTRDAVLAHGADTG